MKKIISTLMLCTGAYCIAGQPIFNITPLAKGPALLTKGQQGTYIYQITNNSNNNLTDIGLINLPKGVSTVANAGYQYCAFPLSLASHNHCLIKLAINSNQSTPHIEGGPQVCFSATNPAYCSQPALSNQLNTQISPDSISSCQTTIANFNSAMSQRMDAPAIDHATIQSWGPNRNHLLLATSNPDLKHCATSDSSDTEKIDWMQQRLIAAEDYWVKQKLNYCHHHVVDFATPLVSNGTARTSIATGQGGYCSNAINVMPGTPYYGQPVRWNYSGSGSETMNNWINNNQMWYGVDCSDFTSFVYNFAFGIQFNSDTGFQAGQAIDGSQDLLTPNGQKPSKKLHSFNNADPDSPAGVLVCKDGRTEQENPDCGGYDTNGYFSAFINSDIHPTPSNITANMLKKLHVGDVLFLAFAKGADGNNAKSIVTHVITWTGKKVGYGANDINPKQIAPEVICPANDWQPKLGDWVIIDSHYQGPDYRVFSACFYQNNIWGVRRIIGYMAPK